MLSTLRKNLIYNNISSDIVEHDLDVDADQWSYDGRDVYRGSVDPDYLSKGLNVYWLYDDNLKRIGLVLYFKKDSIVIFNKSVRLHAVITIVTSLIYVLIIYNVKVVFSLGCSGSVPFLRCS